MSRVGCSYPSCNCSFETESAMLQHQSDRHSQAHHSQNNFPCPLCKRSFHTKGGLEDHLRSAHQLIQTDASTSAAAVAKTTHVASPLVLLQDLQIKTDGVACNDCGKVFRNADFLHQHQWDSANHTRVSKSRTSNHGACVCFCSQCGVRFNSADHLEEHFMNKHPICEIPKTCEYGTWQHVAERFTSAWKKPTVTLYEIHRIFKVYNTGRRRKNFEEYRKKLKKEMSNQRLVSENDHELRNKVLQDGNEVRRYHGTTVKCKLGWPTCEAATTSLTPLSTTSLCAGADCNLCRILLVGFKKRKCKVEKFQRFGKGIYCSSISSKADAYVKCNTSTEKENYKVMIACKVLAGRPFHSTSNREELEGPPVGFHSVQGDPGVALNYEELVVYDDHAILPDFIILYSSSE